MDRVKVLLVDDHQIVRVGLRTLLSRNERIEVTGDTGNPAEILKMVAEQRPDVVIMDVRLPQTGGIESCRQIKARFPEVKVIMLTSYTDEEALWASITAGADGYLLKDIDSDQLANAIFRAADGENLWSGEAVRRVVEDREGPGSGKAENLSPQEERILLLIGEGLSNKAIAKKMGLAETTVRNYVSNIFEKMYFANRAQAAAYAARKRLLGK